MALDQTPPLSPQGAVGIVGLGTWQTAAGTRWVLAALAGGEGSVVSFQLTQDDDKPVLQQAWTSSQISMPQTPVIANGVVFVLSSGDIRRKGKLTGHATLHALDGETGKEIWSSGDLATAPANRTGLTVANGRIFFSTIDSTFYAFGLPSPN